MSPQQPPVTEPKDAHSSYKGGFAGFEFGVIRPGESWDLGLRVSVCSPERFPGCSLGLVIVSSLPELTFQKRWVSNLGSCRSPGCCCQRQWATCRGQELSQHQNPGAGEALDQAEDASPQPWGGEQWGVYNPFLYLSSGANGVGVESPGVKPHPHHPQSRTGQQHR